MAAVSGHSATLALGGTPTTFSNEATTKRTANTVYQITDATKRVVDPDTAITVQVDADGAGAGAYATAASDSYTFDFLTGTVTFTADQGASALVRVSGKFIPLLTVATCDGVDAEYGREELDSAVYSEAAASAIAGRAQCSVTVSVKEDLLTDHDAGAGSLKLVDAILAGTPFFLCWRPDPAGDALRSWGLLSSGAVKASTGSVVGATLKHKAIGRQAVGRSEQASFSWAP